MPLTSYNVPVLILSTIPHYFAIIPWTRVRNTTYPHIIFISSTLSVLWHAYNEPTDTLLFYADHAAAAIWFTYDVRLAIRSTEIKLDHVLILNLLVLVMNLSIPSGGALHCIWHILSAMKCMYISALLAPDFF